MTQRIDAFLKETEEALLPAEYYTTRDLASDVRAKMATAVLQPVQPVDPKLDPFTTGTVSAEWLEDTLRVQGQEAMRKRKYEALASLLKEADDKARVLSRVADEELLAAYRGKLDEILDQAQAAVSKLGGATTAVHAIANDAGSQWKTLTALAEDYRALRRAQITLMPQDIRIAARASDSDGSDDHASDLYLHNLDDLWPTWRRPDAAPAIQYVGARPGQASAPRPQPWPDDRTELLVWLVTSKAEPWMPSVAHVQRLWNDRRTKANPMPTVIRQRPDKPKTLNTVIVGAQTK